MKMKSNFDYLTDVINKGNTSHYDENVERYLRDLEFLLVDVEKKIYLRKFSEATYPIRMVWDLSKDFIEYMIRESSDPKFVKWKEKLKNVKSKRKEAARRHGTRYQDAMGYRTLLDTYPTPDDLYLEGIGQFQNAIEVFSELNKWMHYQFDKNHKAENNGKNIHDKSTLYSHRDKVRYSQPKFIDVVNYLETLWYVVINIMIMSGMFKEVGNYKFDFNRELYDNPTFTFNRLLQFKHIDDLVSGRKKCPICEEGGFSKPTFDENYKRTKPTPPYPFGAFLSCDTCGAKVDGTFKVKYDIPEDSFDDPDCPSPQCRATGSMQKRFSLENPEWGIYTACNKCKWNDRNKNKNVYMGDILSDILSYDDEDDWQYE